MTSIKRIIYLFLISLFIVYSFVIFFENTKNNRGFLSNNAQKGKLVFQKYNCISCHQIYGLGGYMGPDLTNIISANGKGRIYASVFIKNGTNKMPNFEITDDEVNSLLDFLEEIDKSGQSITTDFVINWDGTVTNLMEHEK